MSDTNHFNPSSPSRIKRAFPALALFLCAMLLAGSSRAREAAQARPEPDREDEPREIAIYQALLDLTTPWTVMCVAAHPDDEDGATLTVLRRKGGVHTVTLFSTYGEGGQNAIGPELYEELGAIRARETIEAARVQGSEPHFLGLRDFGFSKSADEALRVWGHDTALARMVLEIRRLRPDVIITNHDTVTGHGHHQATGRLVLEAFDAAADPSRFPEQLREAGVTTWQPQRLFVRFGFEGGPETRALEEEAVRQGQVISITPNERDPVRGLTYAEQALSALRRHASQGPWPSTVPAGWTRAIRYRLARAAKSSAPLPRDAPSFLTGLSLPGNSADQLMPLAARAMLPVYLSNGRKAEGVRDALVAARKAGLFAPSGGDVDDLPRFRLMSDRLDRALALASGIRVRIATREDVLVTDATTPFSLSISNEGERAARITEIDFKDLRSESGIDVPHNLAPGATLNLTASAYAPRSAALSVPHAAHLYDGLLFGVELGARALVELDGARFPVSATTRMDIAPAVEIANLSPNPYVQTPATINRGLTFKLRLVNHRRAQFDGSVGVASPDSSRMPAFRTEVSLGPNETRDLVLRSNPVSARRAPGRRRALLAGGGGDEPGTVEVSLYSEHDPKSPIARQSAQLVYSEARVAPSLRVGFVPSFDETLKNALAALGVQSRELTVDDVRAGRLGRYDAIIIDNRGYQSHPELVAANARLLDYVRAGGNLVVFYHKTNEWNPSPKVNRPQLAPYALVLGNSRVTDENAPVTFSEPAHALLRWPNPISADDFKGWIQERGLYYPQEWDAAHYSAPLSMSDAGEPPLRGGLLAADYGRGRYIYTGIVWYRQLRAGVPGAYRMFANIISYGRAPRETKRARERAAADAAALDAWPLSK